MGYTIVLAALAWAASWLETGEDDAPPDWTCPDGDHDAPCRVCKTCHTCGARLEPAREDESNEAA